MARSPAPFGSREANRAAALLHVQRVSWQYGQESYSGHLAALQEAGATIEQETIDSATRRASTWDKCATAAIAVGLISLLFLGVHIVFLVSIGGHALLNNAPVLESTAALLVSAGITVVVAALAFALTLLCEHRCLNADRHVMYLCNPNRLCEVSWEQVDVEQLPAHLITVVDRYPFMHDRLWQAFEGVDSHTVEVLAGECGMSVSQLRRAATLLT